MTDPTPPILEVQNLCVHAGGREILRGVNFSIPARKAFGLIGPSGAGKSTLLKCLNRLVELTPQLRVTGDVRFHGQSIYAPEVDADHLRERIGIIFQQPVIFPHSIERNVLFVLWDCTCGHKLLERKPQEKAQVLVAAGASDD